MITKTQQLQIRVTADQKRRLQHLSQAAGQTISAYVLDNALPQNAHRFASLVRAIREPSDRRAALASLNDLLTGLSPVEFQRSVRDVDLCGVSPRDTNYVAAMVELAAAQKEVPVPAWIRGIVPLSQPYFATELKSLRPHLLRASPVPFKRRNIFVDASIGDRV